MAFLSDAIRPISVTEGFRNVLSPKQLDNVDCAALELSAAVTEYLALAIQYFTDKSIGVHPPRNMNSDLMFGSVADAKNALQGKMEFVSVREDIEKRILAYTRAMGSLTATMAGELLRHDKDDERMNILVWLWGGNYWQRHDDLNDKRVSNTGTWIFRSPEYQNWHRGDSSRSLICHGMGK